MRFALCLCVLIVSAAFLTSADARKTFSTRRKSGGSSSNRRGGSTNYKNQQPAQPATSHNVGTFLNAERAGSSHGSPAATNTHYRGNLFDNKPSVSDTPRQTASHSNGPIGFEKFGNQGNQKLGFDKVSSDVQQKPAGAPPYPGSPNLGKPAASAPNGPPPAYPGYGAQGTGSHAGSYEPPPAYPGRPVNAPPVYSANNPSYGQNMHGVGGYPGHQGSYPGQSYPHQQGAYQGHGYPGQLNSGYPNAGGTYNNYPNQGYNQGFGSHSGGGYGNWNSGGYGQYSPGFGGHSYGGSSFGHSNPYGGSPFASSGFGGNSFGSGGYGNPHYSSNNFGFSHNPGLFGSSSYPGKYGSSFGNFGYHKKSRFGGLPIPIPIPIPIPLGGFGGWGGRSYNHRVLDSFVKDKNITTSDNDTTSVFILNNSTVTPCTTDQFIYDSLNVTILSCTADFCTAVKVFTTTNVSGEISTHSAGITMCLEHNTTYSSFADNVNPIVSDVQKTWMKICKELVDLNTTQNVSKETAASFAVKVSEISLDESMKDEEIKITDQSSIALTSPSSSTQPSTSDHLTTTSSISSSTNFNEFFSTNTNNASMCEIFNCSMIKMCMPSIEIVDRCLNSDCPFTRTGYQPCVQIKMCRSPSTPISTFATLNNTISRIDQFNNVTSVNDIANLTLISFIPPSLPINCSQDTTDPACLPPVNLPQEPCHLDTSMEGNNSSLCSSTFESGRLNSSSVEVSTEASATELPIFTGITPDVPVL